jgi:di/tricarboxylate transporter
MTFALPNYHALAVIVLIVATLFAYSRERWLRETVSLMVIAVLAMLFELFPMTLADGSQLTPTSFFLGFGHEALIAVAGLIILGQGLVRTGALEPIGRLIGNIWRKSPTLAILPTLLLCMAMSAFVNNITIVLVLLPILLGVAMRSNLSSSSILLPVGLITIVGGMSTTIGTSTNLLVVGVSADMGVAPFRMFDFLLPALIAGVFAVAYLWLIAPRLLPERQAPLHSGVKRLYTAQVRLGKSSDAVGKSLSEAIERCDGNLKVEKIQRGPGVFVTPLPDVVLKAGDRLTTTNTQENLRELARMLGGKLYSGDVEVDDAHPLGPDDQKIAEVAVTPSSRLIGTRIGAARLLTRYGLKLLALHRFNREEQTRSTALDNTVLKSGDVLLVQAPARKLEGVKDGPDLLVLDGSIKLPKTTKAPIALGIMVSVIVLAATGLLPIALAALFGVIALIMTRCLSWSEAMGSISLQLVLVVVASLALSAALMQTGGSVWIAQLIHTFAAGISPLLLLAGVMLAMAVLANLVTNYAAAIVVTPIAVSLAQQFMLPAEPLVLAVLFGANLSFATPTVYKTNLLVMNAGGYKYKDFVRVGLPLMFILWIVLTATLNYAYQL